MFAFRLRRTTQGSGKSRRLPHARRLFVQSLEERTVLAAVSWINPSGGAWDVASNWSNGAVPTAGDDVTIDTASATTISIHFGDGISVNSVTTGANDTLSLSGGSLTVAAASALDGPLAMTGGSLTASGSMARLSANGDTTISGAGLYANSGGTLSLPKLTSYTTSGSAIGASGAGSLVDLSSLANLTCSGWFGISATSGGEINLNSLASFQGSGNPDSVSFTDTGGSTIVDGSLKRLDAIDVILDGTDQHVGDAWTQCTNGWLEVSGGACTLPALIDVDGTGLEVKAGGRLALPSVTDFTGSFRDSFIQGPGSVLDLSALKTQSGTCSLLVSQGAEVKLTGLTSMNDLYISDTGGSKVLDGNVTSLSHVGFTLDGTDTQVANSWTSIAHSGLTFTGGSYNLSALTDLESSGVSVTDGGRLVLSGLTGVGADPSGISFTASGAGSTLDLSALTALTPTASVSFNATYGGRILLTGLTDLNSSGLWHLQMTDTGGGAIVDSNLTHLTGVLVTSDGTDAHLADAWTSFVNGELKLTGGVAVLPDVADADGAELVVTGGGSLTLPALKSYDTGSPVYGDGFEADGSGSTLDLAALESVTEQNGRGWNVVVSGGEIELPALTNLAGSASRDLSVSFKGNGTIAGGSPATLSYVDVRFEGSGIVAGLSWAKVLHTNLYVSGSSVTLASLTDLTGTNVNVSNGARLSMPSLTTVVYDGGGFTVEGAGSVLDVSALNSLSSSLSGQTYFSITANDGGQIMLAALTELSRGNAFSFVMTDTGGSAIVDSSLTSLAGVQVISDGSDAHFADAWTSFVNGEMKLTGGATTLPNVADADGSELLATNGAVLTLPALTSYDTGLPVYGSTFEADGSGSALNLPALTGITEQNGAGWNVTVAGGGEVNLPALTNLSGTESRRLSVTFSGSGTIADSSLTTLSYLYLWLNGPGANAGAAWTQLLHSNLWVNGGSETFSPLTNMDGTGVDVNSGGRLVLPALTNFVCDGSFFFIRGAGSELDIPALTSVSGQGEWSLSATDGSTINLTGLHSLSPPSLGQIVLNDFNGSTILDPNLSSLNGVQVWTDGTDAQLGDAWTSFTNGGMNVGENGGTTHAPSLVGALTLPNVANAEGSGLTIRDGGSLIFPALKQVSTFLWMSVDGTGSTLDFPALTSFTSQYSNDSITATNGAQIKLPVLSTLRVNSGYLSIVDTNGSAVALPSTLTDLNGVNFTIDGTDSQVANAWTTLANGSITLIGGSYALPNLTDLDGSSLDVQNGASLSLPSLSSYTSNGASFVVSGAGSVLDASRLVNALLSGGWSVRAAVGGDIKLHGLTSVASNQAVNFAAEGAGSAIEMPNLATFTGSNSSVTVGDGGSIALGAQTLSMPSAGSGLSIIVPQLSFDVPVNLSSTGTFKDATFFIGAARVNITDGTFAGNTMLSVNKQATLDLTGGNLVDYSGTLGAIPAMEYGTVRLASGGVVVGPSGLSLDFPPGMFQWTGGEFYASSAAVTNAGSLEIGPAANLTDTGSLINRGILTLDAGSRLAVGGDFTQAPGGALNFGIAGPPASGQFGQLTVKNNAALGGDLAAALSGGFTPQDNQVFPAMSFASASGDFSNVAALGPALFERLQPTSLDLVTSLHDSIDSPLGATLNATEGTTFSGAVASFSDANPLARASDFTATIDWGDGTTSSASISADNAGGFSITGSHVYTEEGTETLTISVANLGGSSATIQGRAIVGEAAVSADGATLTVGQAVSLTSAVIATFTHGDDAEPPADFTAAIDWGDGQTSAGAVVESNGTYSVSGSHAYAQSGAFTVKTTIADDGVSTVIAGSATVLSPDAMRANYVTAVYEDVLGRTPDAGGLAYWTKQLDGGAAISSVAESIAHSDEYYANFVIKPDFLKLLGRAADNAAVTYWTAQKHAGLTDQQLEAELVASDEFYKAAENFDPAPDADDTTIADLDHNTDWVDAVYKLLLGRMADSAGEAYWTRQLAAGVSRGDVALSIANGAENNSQLINADYLHYLGRAADSDGLKYWLQQFADGKANEDVIAGFTGSDEYYKNHAS